MKKGPLNKVEKFYIENNRKESVQDIAKTLGRTESIVKNYLTKVQKEEPNTQNDSPEQTNTGNDFIKKNIIHETEGKKQKVAIMTEQASMHIDASRNKKSRKLPDYVTKINKD